MHEMGIAAEVLRVAREECAARGEGRLAGVKVRVGRWSGVEPESLRLALDVLADAEGLSEWLAEIEVVEPAFTCGQCGARYPGADYLQPCPECGGPAAELVCGDELLLAELRVEDS